MAPPPSTEAAPRRWTLLFPSLSAIQSFFDITTVVLIICFLSLSLLSLSFIVYLRLKSRRSVKLREFSAHWTARLLMTLLVSLWAINEFLRLPLLRKRDLFPFLPPPLSPPLQGQFCKLHLILSFGFYEPGFLISLLFIVTLSIKKRSPNNLWAFGLVIITCLPLVVTLYLAVYVLPGKVLPLPPVFHRSSVMLEDERSRAQVVYCTYPLLTSVIFTAFGLIYTVAFLTLCCKVMALAINTRLRARVSTLAYAIVVCLSVQLVMLTVSVFWDPDNVLFYGVVLVNFGCVLICGAVGEGILVIKPIIEALSVGTGGNREDGCL